MAEGETKSIFIVKLAKKIFFLIWNFQWDPQFENELISIIFVYFFFFLSSIGDIQPIAGQVIDLAKKNCSSDNISVIAVFFKDPNQIVAEYKSRASAHITSMDFESANGCQFDTDNLATNNECATKVTVDALQMHDNAEFYFGKNGDADDFHHHHNNHHQTDDLRSNGDGDKFSSNDEHDDFGPETDVDATDDNAISPISPSVSVFSSYFSFLFIVVTHWTTVHSVWKKKC